MKWSWIGLVLVVVGILVLVLPHLINWLIGIGIIVAGVLHFIQKWSHQVVLITNNLQKRGKLNASILYEMSFQERNQGCQGHNHEEWQAGNPGNMSGMWHKDVQNRLELDRFPQLNIREGQAFEWALGLFLCTIHLFVTPVSTSRMSGFDANGTNWARLVA